MSDKAAKEYSTNLSIVNDRRRTMSLRGVKKIEDAARTADYKAMCYIRNIVKAKPDFLAAPDDVKVSMLEQAMRNAMEKRRAKGQDTMSKLARQGTNDACASKGGSGSSQTRVPIAQFLENNGFVPARADRESQVSDAFIPRPSNSHMDRPSSALIPGSGSAESGLTRTNSSHFQSILSPGNSDIKVSDTVTPFANMTAERMDLDVNITALRHEVSSLRNMCQNVLSSSSHLRNYELHHTSADPALDMRDPPDLIGRLAYLEGAVHSIQSVSVPAMVGRLAALEGDVEEMKTGMGVQVARMREAFGRLREALGCVDAFQ